MRQFVKAAERMHDLSIVSGFAPTVIGQSNRSSHDFTEGSTKVYLDLLHLHAPTIGAPNRCD